MLMMNNPHFPFDEGLGGPAPALEVSPPNDVSGQTVYLPADFRPSRNDVICSRGSVSFHHAANARLRELIDASLDEYKRATTKGGRSQIVTSIIEILQQERGGMFVRQDNKTNRWYQVSQRAMREKVGQAIRAALKRNHSTPHSGSADDASVQTSDDPLRKPSPQIYPEGFLPESYPEEQKLSSLSETSKASLPISPTTFSRGLLQLREDPPSTEYGLYQVVAGPPTSVLNLSPPIHAAATEMGNADETRRRLMEYALANRMISNPSNMAGSYYPPTQQHHSTTAPFGFGSNRQHGVLGYDTFVHTGDLPHGIPLSVSDRFRTAAAMDSTTALPSSNFVHGGESRPRSSEARASANMNTPADILGLDPLEEDETQLQTRYHPPS